MRNYPLACGEPMLVAGCSMLVDDPVFSGDKSKNDSFQIQYPETSIHNLFELGTTVYRNLGSI
jgi:hypothetical protein